MGGTSGKGVFVAIGSVFVYLLYLLLIPSLFGTSGIVFGTGEGENGITGEKTRFNQEEIIHYQVDFDEQIDSATVEIYVLKVNDGHEKIFVQYEESVDLSWPGFFTVFYDPFYRS